MRFRVKSYLEQTSLRIQCRFGCQRSGIDENGRGCKNSAFAEIEKAQYTLEGERLRAEEIAREEVAKLQMEIAAEAEAERLVAEPLKVLLMRHLQNTIKKNEGVKAVLEAKAAGYASLVQSAGGDAKAAATLLMVEKLKKLLANKLRQFRTSRLTRLLFGIPQEAGMGKDHYFLSKLCFQFDSQSTASPFT